MIILSSLIKEHASEAATKGDWESVAKIINGLTQTISDPTQWSFGLMMSQGNLPQMLVAGIADAVKKAGQSNSLIDSAFIAFSTTGIQLHTPERQAMIDAIGAELPVEAVAAVKALGVRTVLVYGSEVTAEQCQTEFELASLQQEWSTLQNEKINPAADNREDLISALRAAADALESGQ